MVFGVVLREDWNYHTYGSIPSSLIKIDWSEQTRNRQMKDERKEWRAGTITSP